MISHISERVLLYIKCHLEINDEMAEVYKYGIEITLSSLLNVVLILMVSAIIGDIVSGVVFLLCIIPVRSYCGGYHASTYLLCNLVFTLTYLLVHYFGLVINALHIETRLSISICVAIISFIPVVLFSPVKNRHKKLSKDKAHKCRLISLILFIFFSITSLILIINNLDCGTTLVMTLAAVSVLIIIEISMQRRGYHESE